MEVYRKYIQYLVMELNFSISSYIRFPSMYLKIKQEPGTLLHGRSLSRQPVLLVGYVCLISNKSQSTRVKKLAELIKDININRILNLNKASGTSVLMYCKAANPEKSKKMSQGPAGIFTPVTY